MQEIAATHPDHTFQNEVTTLQEQTRQLVDNDLISPMVRAILSEQRSTALLSDRTAIIGHPTLTALLTTPFTITGGSPYYILSLWGIHVSPLLTLLDTAIQAGHNSFVVNCSQSDYNTKHLTYCVTILSADPIRGLVSIHCRHPLPQHLLSSHPHQKPLEVGYTH